MITEGLDRADLIIDEVYGGSRHGNASDDPLAKLLGVDNGAGFRHLGKRPAISGLKMLALKSSLADVNWPDSVDRERGRFTFYGDNRRVKDLHDTPRQGNLILRNLFEETHRTRDSERFPPIFLFGNTGVYRDVRFLGLAVPGADGLSSDDDLVAIWRTGIDGARFQNYKATFTILDVGLVKRAWIEDIKLGHSIESPHAPETWKAWVRGRKYQALRSVPILTIRSRAAQLPSEALRGYVELIHETYESRPYDFERCAMEIAKLFLPDIHTEEITRPWKDGGRDAIGLYRIGQDAGAIDVEFALEAKCFALTSAVGVSAIARLVSRLRHRQFGIIVTTSYLHAQAYQEVIDDGHPVVVIAAVDIAQKLKQKFGSLAEVHRWLAQLKPRSLSR